MSNNHADSSYECYLPEWVNGEPRKSVFPVYFWSYRMPKTLFSKSFIASTDSPNLGRMRSTGEPDAVKWFWKKVSLVWIMIFLFAIYVVFEIVTVSAVFCFYRELFDHDSKSILPPGECKMWKLIPEICSIFHKLSYDTFG